MPTPLSTRLLPELELELAKTRKLLEHLPEDHNDFRPHPRAGTLARIAGHVVDLVFFLEQTLTAPELDFGTDHRQPLILQRKPELLEALEHNANRTLDALRSTSDGTFDQDFRFLFNGRVVFSGSRYTAYRINCLDHLLHHRAQLGVYLRLLDQKVPAIFGPSADEHY